MSGPTGRPRTRTVPAGTLAVRWLGRVRYADAWSLQDALVRARRDDEVSDTLLLLEHPPVITLGRRSNPAHLLVDREVLEASGIELHETNRGGDVTFHGPGQLVGYPVLALRGRRRDAHRYLRDLEEALARVAQDFGVAVRRHPGLTGIWAGDRKLAAIGVRISTGWVTSHGFALNVHGDLGGFEAIVPCGIPDKGVTSLELLTGRPVTLEEAAQRVARHLGDVFGLRPVFQAR